MHSPNSILRPDEINRSWTLFIDRDGVINRKRDHDYVKNWDEFIFIPGSIAALRVLSSYFGRLILVTNQRGIGRKLMREADLADIHRRMLLEIESRGGRLDALYHCPDLAEEDERGWRKPKIGMALQAKADFPEIDFQRSIMIGDSMSDMQFGRNAGMKTVWVSDQPIPSEAEADIDLQVSSLAAFGAWLSKVPLSEQEL